jgi:hypothetical protein
LSSFSSFPSSSSPFFSTFSLCHYFTLNFPYHLHPPPPPPPFLGAK